MAEWTAAIRRHKRTFAITPTLRGNLKSVPKEAKMNLILRSYIFGIILSIAAQAANAVNDQVPLNGPWGIAISGNLLYVADTLNDIVRVVDISTGKINKLYVSGPTFYRPDGIAVAGQTIFVGDSGRISKIDSPNNVATIVAGTGRAGSTDGIGRAATLNSPSALLVDGNLLFVADASNHNVRKIEIATGKVTTLCGSGKKEAVDGPPNVASLSPWGMAKAGNYLYATDFENNKIRKIDISTGYVSTLAGGGGKGFRSSGSDDGIQTAASFNNPWGIASDGANLYIADSQNNKIRKVVIETGKVSTLAGGGGQGINGAGLLDGIGTGAAFNSPAGMTISGSSLYVVDRGNNTVRKVDVVTGEVTTVLQPVYIATSTNQIANKLLSKAEAGDPEMQYKLGELYSKEAGEIGKSIDTDLPDRLQNYTHENAKKEKLRMALKWYLKAAEQGHALSQYRVAKLSGDGIYIDGKPEDFYKWYLKAAEQGIPEAEEAIGAIYLSGLRVFNYNIRPDPVEAFKWNLKAATHGREYAQIFVGTAYERGEGVTKDPKEAAKWYLKAAEKGNIVAQNSLGCLLTNGAPGNYVQGFMWLEIVLATPDSWDRDTACSNNAAKVTTSEQREKAKQLARDWSAKHKVVEH